jgi:hypothetical protein
MLSVVNFTLSEVDAVFSLVLLCGLDEVADLALEADVGDEALARFDIEAWEVSGIGITVWIGVLCVEEEEEVVAIFHDDFLWGF